MIRIALLLAACALAACSTYQATVGSPKRIPAIDLTNAKWQKLTANQPDSNPLRFAIVERNEKFAITRLVVKAPPAFTLPPYWLTAKGNYTVLKGTFVFDAVDAKGNHEKRAQGPGTFAELPKNFIVNSVTRPGSEALLQITVYGDWSLNVPEGAWTQQTANKN
jgi:hypothetical protein